MDKRSVVRVEVKKDGEHVLLGTGFAVAVRTIATCRHVVAAARGEPLIIRYGSGERSAARILASDDRHDVSLIVADVDPELMDFVPASLLKSGKPGPTVNDTLFVYGQSWQSQGKALAYHATLAGFDEVTGDCILSGSVNPGDSGGPVVLAGQVVGIARSKHRTNEGQAKAVAVRFLRELLETNGITPAPRADAPDLPTLKQVKMDSLERTVAFKARQYEAEAQRLHETVGADRMMVEQRLQHLEKEMKEVEGKINELREGA